MDSGTERAVFLLNGTMLHQWINNAGNVIWGPWTVAVLLGVGTLLTVQNHFLQFKYIRLWLNQTIGQLCKRRVRGENGVTRAQALAAALAGTMGTGNIVGVATALSLGGAGTLFWMWVSALFGMMLKYAEVVLAVKFRCRDANGQWVGGAIEVITNGLNRPRMAGVFAVCCVAASLGMGNTVQANAIAQSVQSAFDVPSTVCGAVCAGVTALVIFGGFRRIARVAEAVIPVLSIAYTAGGIAVICKNIHCLVPMLCAVLRSAFSWQAAAGGAVGVTVAAAMRHGISTGIFSNEAGLGSSGMAYAAAENARPAEQGMWGIFEVFFDTIVVCSITALAILTSGVPIGEKTGAALTIAAFETLFGAWGGKFVATAVTLFAFASMLGWAYYGERAFVRLSGTANGYRVLFVLMAYIGSVMQLELVWGMSELFNGFMMIPNLISIVLLAPTVRTETTAFLDSLKHER